MQVLRSIEAARHHLEPLWRQQRSTALVPTMGGLHPGHVALLKMAARCADTVVASLFVNPLQFDREEDFRLYPRHIEQDLACLRRHHVAYAFAPDAQLMFATADDVGIRITPGALGHELCGHYRPGHFQGVLTVVAKLLNIFAPDVAVFGEKDYQQLFLIQNMVASLNFGCRIVAVPTLRASDGLAYSSRNSYLNPAQRAQAPLLYAQLSQLAERICSAAPAPDQYAALAENAARFLHANAFEVEYLEVRDVHTLGVPNARSRQLIVVAAARLGQARLIDNVLFSRT